VQRRTSWKMRGAVCSSTAKLSSKKARFNNGSSETVSQNNFLLTSPKPLTGDEEHSIAAIKQGRRILPTAPRQEKKGENRIGVGGGNPAGQEDVIPTLAAVTLVIFLDIVTRMVFHFVYCVTRCVGRGLLCMLRDRMGSVPLKRRNLHIT
jgi:hypothetical protein